MKNIGVFIPTRLPGFDVTFNSLKRQKLNDVSITVIVADELGVTRGESIADQFNNIGIEYVGFTMSKNEGYERNLAASYNQAIAFARLMELDGLVSLQDYIWVPEDGVQKFVDASDQLEELGIKHILTGICHITDDPAPDKVVNPKGSFTIFEKPYDEEPTIIQWTDVRKENNERTTSDPEALLPTSPIEWEANWAYIPKEALYDDELRYDEAFDKYVAYENQDYAFKAKELGYETVIDTHNEVKSLPHKKYWPEMEAHEGPLTLNNKELLDSKYGEI